MPAAVFCKHSLLPTKISFLPLCWKVVWFSCWTSHRRLRLYSYPPLLLTECTDSGRTSKTQQKCFMGLPGRLVRGNCLTSCQHSDMTAGAQMSAQTEKWQSCVKVEDDGLGFQESWTAASMIIEGSQFPSLKSVKLLLTKLIGKKLIPPKAKARLNHEQNPAPTFSSFQTTL